VKHLSRAEERNVKHNAADRPPALKRGPKRLWLEALQRSASVSMHEVQKSDCENAADGKTTASARTSLHSGGLFFGTRCDRQKRRNASPTRRASTTDASRRWCRSVRDACVVVFLEETHSNSGADAAGRLAVPEDAHLACDSWCARVAPARRWESSHGGRE